MNGNLAADRDRDKEVARADALKECAQGGDVGPGVWMAKAGCGIFIGGAYSIYLVVSL
jgi:hypothetical protein